MSSALKKPRVITANTAALNTLQLKPTSNQEDSLIITYDSYVQLQNTVEKLEQFIRIMVQTYRIESDTGEVVTLDNVKKFGVPGEGGGFGVSEE